MKVSIIIPIYNGEKYIDTCLTSCINQTYDNIEIICVDDGSIDNTKEHIEAFKKRYNNIILIEQGNAGVSIARNTGIKNASGEYLMFVDADDYIAETMVETMLTKLMKTNADAVKCNIETSLKFLKHTSIEKEYFYQGEDFQNLLHQKLLEDNGIFSSACNGLYKKELCPFFPTDLCLGEDVIFNFKYFLKNSSVLFIKERLYFYRDNQKSATHNKNLDVILRNLEHFNSYDHIDTFLKSLDPQVIDKEIFLEKAYLINYAAYIRLTFQVFNVTSVFKGVAIARKYYKLHEEIFSKVTKKIIKDFLLNSYNWPNFKIDICVIPLHKKHFLNSYIGYKIIYKNFKKLKKNS